MAEETLEQRLAKLYAKRDFVDRFNEDDVKTLIDAIRDAREHGGTASVDITPLSGGGGYTITITDSEGTEHTATVKDGGDAYEVYVSTVPQDQTPMSKAEWLASLKGDKGNNGSDGHNPCLGVFADQTALETAHPTTEVGDYAYADVTDSTTQTTAKHIFRYSGNAWEDYGVGSPDSVTAFDGGAGPTVAGTKIDDTRLANPAPNALAKATDVMQLAAKLEGATASETKISYIDGSLLTGHYVGRNGSTSDTSSSYDCATFDVDGYKAVRFLGIEMSTSQYSRGYAFYDANGDYLEDTYVRYDVAGDEVLKTKKYVVEIPNGAKYFKTNVRFNTLLTADNFYCYLQSEKKVIDLIPQVVDNLSTDDATKALSAKQGMLLRSYSYAKSNIEDEQSILITSNYLRGFYPNKDNYVWTESGSQTATGGWLIGIENQNTVMIEGHDYGNTFITFLKSIPDKSSLSNGDPLDVCDGQLNRRYIVGKEIIPIPEDCECIYVINSTSSNVQQSPKSISIYSDKPLKDIVSEQQAEINDNKDDIETILNPYTDIDLLQIGTRINNWYIGVSGANLNLWHYYGNNKVGCIYINVTPGQVYRVEKDSSDSAAFTFLKTIPDFDEHTDHVNFTPDYAEGIDGNIFIGSGEDKYVIEVAVPSDARYMCFVRQSVASGETNGKLPTRVALKSKVQRLDNIEKRLAALEDPKGSNQQDLFNIQANRIKNETISRAVNVGLTPIVGQAKSYLINNISYTGTQPTSVQQKLIQEKADKLIGVRWVPKHNVPAKVEGSPFIAGGEVTTGIPYSNNMSDMKLVGINVSIYTFLTAIDNPYSLMYTEDIDSNKTVWGRVYENHNGDAYYGSMCCGFTSAVLGLPVYVRNQRHFYAAEYYGVFAQMAPVGEVNWDVLQIGDVFDRGGHAFIVYDIIRDGETNEILYVYDAECTSSYGQGGCRTERFTKVRFQNEVASPDGSGLANTHFKCTNLWANRPFKDDEAPSSYNKAISTIYGDRVSLAKGELVVINYNLYGTQDYSWTKIVVEKDGEPFDEFTLAEAQQTLVDFYANDGSPITPDPFNSGLSEDNHALVLGKGLAAGNYTAYMSDGTNTSEPIIWEVVDGGVNDFTIVKNADGSYTVTNNTQSKIEMLHVIVGKKIEGDYRGMKRYRTTRPITLYENARKQFTIFPNEMKKHDKELTTTEPIVCEDLTIILKGKYGSVMTLPIELPTE